MKQNSFTRWAANSKLLSFPRKKIGAFIPEMVRQRGGIVFFGMQPTSENQKILDIITSIKKDGRNAMENLEYQNLYTWVKKTEKIPGEIAEVGVYRGGSSKIICETTKKPIYLFDTFEGMPDIMTKNDPDWINKGFMTSSFSDVKNYLSSYKNVRLYKGLFPQTASPIEDKKFSFVNLDVDIYESTVSCLKFFYPRMAKGGMIVSHDYGALRGVTKAFDDFFADKPEIVLDPRPGSTQCVVIKL